MATAILAETSAPPLWGWPSTSTLESVEAETGEQVDDLRVTNSFRFSAYLQAKLTLSLSSLASSDFASVISAFVRQYLGDGEGEEATFGGDDRLVLAVGASSSGLIREDLRRLLERSRGLLEDRTLDSIAGSKRERKVIEAFLGHVRAAWRDAKGSDPSESELREFVSKIWISVFDLSDDGVDTRVAQGQLRSSVLTHPAQEAQAWGILISLVAGLSATQSGADRQRLQELLAGKGVELRAAPSYRADIKRLHDYSAGTAERLRALSRILLPGEGGEIKLKRLLPSTVLGATTEDSLLITGDPGVGKSASAFELISTLEGEGRDVLAFAADALDVDSLGQLRDELGLEHEVVDVLRNWPGVGPGVLVIDGLDAARGEGTQDALLDLIAATSITASRWNVVASIRRFDLRYNHKLKELFPVEPAATVPREYVSAEFDTVRHLVVPDLSDEELSQLGDLAPALGAFLEAAPDDLRDLARVPFNLRLLAELVRLDVDPSELEPVTTQVQLLDKYWEYRVIGSDREGDARRAVVGEVVRDMVANRRLQANRRNVVGADSPAALNHLLSEYVLAEQGSGSGPVEDEIITFSHHVLFDYAVERALLRGTDEARTEAILANPDLLIFARPSFDLHFRHLWEADAERRRFWDASVDLASAQGVPRIGRVIAPVAAAELIRDVDDFRPLLRQLSDPDEARRTAAEETLRHLIGSAISGDPKVYLRDQTRLAAWAQFSAALADCELRAPIAFSLRQIVWSLSDDAGALDPARRDELGRAARRLLSYALDQPEPERALTWPGIAAVAATFESDPARSRELLGRILLPERLERFGYLEMPDLAQQVEGLIDHDPGFVRDIYAAAFSFEETSKDTTEMGGGTILRLNSNRRQDYSGAQYTLADAFPRFLEEAPSEATEALVAVRIFYARKRFSESRRGSISIPWVEGRETLILADGNAAWDQEPLGHDDEVKILDAFAARLDELAEHDVAALADLIDLLSRLEAPASIWRRVFVAASRRPETFAPLIRPLLVSPQVLALRGLTAAAGEFLAAGFPLLDPGLRADVERTIFGLANHVVEANPELGEHAADIGGRLRDRVLGCLRPSDLADPEIKAHLQKLVDAQEVPSNVESGAIAEWGSSEYGERDFLAEAGVDVDSKPNRRIQALIEPVREFAQEHLNGSPSREEVEGVVKALQKLWNALRTASSDGVDERQADQGFGYAAEAAEAISRGKTQEQAVPSLQLAKEILMAAAAHREPTHDPEADASFDEHPSWGSPAPRIEAAAGLIALASDGDHAEPDVLLGIEKLSCDPVPAVRFQIARRLRLLVTTAPEVMWKIADAIAASEPSRAVTDAMLAELPAITGGDPIKRREVAEFLYLRTPAEGPGSQHLRSTSVAILGDLDVGSGDKDAADFIRREVLADLGQNGEIARSLIFRLRSRSAFTFGGEDPKDSAIRVRAISVVDDTLRSAIDQYEAIDKRLNERKEAPGDEDPDLKARRNVAQLIDSIAAEVYFASGAFKGNGDEPRATPEQRARLYREAGTVLDCLAGVPLAPVTHHLLETLEACIEFDPRGVFLRISRAIEGGTAGGYQLDTMAANLFVSLVERYLAEYRTLFQRYEDMRRSLIEMLDLFVDAGWPKARQLTYGLHELFR
jgi:hypothetical protein